MSPPLLVSSRWQLSEFVFIEYRHFGIMIDVGPFPRDPNDEEVEVAYGYLKECAPGGLSLGDTEWTLDLNALTQQLPPLAAENLSGVRTHPPAFETISILVPHVDRFYNKDLFNLSLPPGVYFLRVQFLFEGYSTEASVRPQTLADRTAQETELQDASVSEDVTLSQKPETSQEDAFCFYSQLDPTACLAKLSPYHRSLSDSPAVERTPHPFEFETTTSGRSFTVRRSTSLNSALYRGCVSGVLRAEGDGGTTITGQYHVEAANVVKSATPYLAMVMGLLFLFMGLQYVQPGEGTDSTRSLGFFSIVVAAALIVLAFNSLGKNNQARRSVYEGEKNSLIDFVQKLFEAETVDR